MEALLDRDKLVFDPPEWSCVLCLSGLPGGSGKIYDRSPYGNTGTVTGATWKRLPGGLWCLSFDGQDDHINCGNASGLSLTGDASWEWWFKRTSYMYLGCFICKWYANEFDIYQLTDNNISLSHGDGTSNEKMQFTTTVDDGIWYHVVITRTASPRIARCYVNGIQVDTDKSYSLTPASSTHWVSIGRRSEGTAQCLNGMVALVGVYHRALSALDVQNSFHREKHLFGAC